MSKVKTIECPYCKEEIKETAIKCKHCLSMLAPQKLEHNGTCPYCKEEIKPDAIRCKHCKSDLLEKKSGCGCGCGGNVKNEPAPMRKRIGGLGMTIDEYQECYLDCSFDHPAGSLAQNVCFQACDRRYTYPLPYNIGMLYRY